MCHLLPGFANNPRHSVELLRESKLIFSKRRDTQKFFHNSTIPIKNTNNNNFFLHDSFVEEYLRLGVRSHNDDEEVSWTRGHAFVSPGRVLACPRGCVRTCVSKKTNSPRLGSSTTASDTLTAYQLSLDDFQISYNYVYALCSPSNNIVPACLLDIKQVIFFFFFFLTIVSRLVPHEKLRFYDTIDKSKTVRAWGACTLSFQLCRIYIKCVSLKRFLSICHSLYYKTFFFTLSVQRLNNRRVVLLGNMLWALQIETLDLL